MRTLIALLLIASPLLGQRKIDWVDPLTGRRHQATFSSIQSNRPIRRHIVTPSKEDVASLTRDINQVLNGWSPDDSREWTSSKGKKKTAALISFTPKSVTLDVSGKEVTIKLTRLSKDDQQYIKFLIARRSLEAEFRRGKVKLSKGSPYYFNRLTDRMSAVEQLTLEDDSDTVKEDRLDILYQQLAQIHESLAGETQFVIQSRLRDIPVDFMIPIVEVAPSRNGPIMTVSTYQTELSRGQADGVDLAVPVPNGVDALALRIGDTVRVKAKASLVGSQGNVKLVKSGHARDLDFKLTDVVIEIPNAKPIAPAKPFQVDPKKPARPNQPSNLEGLRDDIDGLFTNPTPISVRASKPTDTKVFTLSKGTLLLTWELKPSAGNSNGLAMVSVYSNDGTLVDGVRIQTPRGKQTFKLVAGKSYRLKIKPIIGELHPDYYGG